MAHAFTLIKNYQSWLLAGVASVCLHAGILFWLLWSNPLAGSGQKHLGASGYLNNAITVDFRAFSEIQVATVAQQIAEPEVSVVTQFSDAASKPVVEKRSSQSTVPPSKVNVVEESVGEAEPLILEPDLKPQLVKENPKASSKPKLVKKLEEQAPVLSSQGIPVKSVKPDPVVESVSDAAKPIIKAAPKPQPKLESKPQVEPVEQIASDRLQPESISKQLQSAAVNATAEWTRLTDEALNQIGKSGNLDSEGQGEELGDLKTLPAYTQRSIKYPKKAQQKGLEGTVEVKITVSVKGKVTKAKIYISSGHVELDKAALKAVRRWDFKPATLNGIAQSGEVIVPYEFRLN